MKKTIKGYILGFLTAVILIGGATYAAQTVRIVLNGIELVPTDVTGKRVAPILADGTTYLPVRAIADALGLEVAWDEETYTVSLTKPVEEKQEEIKETPVEEVKEDIKEEVPETETNENVFEGIAQVTTNNIDKETSKLWDKEKNKIYTVDGVYMLGDWGHYRVVDGKLEYFEIIDHYGWKRAKVEKTRYDVDGLMPKFQIKLEDGTILTNTTRIIINGKRYRVDDGSKAMFENIQSEIGVGEIWYLTYDNGEVSKIETIK